MNHFKTLVFLTSVLVFLSSGAAQDLVIDGGSQTLSGEHNYDEVRIVNGGDLYIEDYSNGGGKLTLNANTIYIDSSSRIYGSARGYSGGPGGSGSYADPGTGGSSGSGTGSGTNGNTGGDGDEDGGGGGAGAGSYGGSGGPGGNGGDAEYTSGGAGGSAGSTYGSTTSQSIEMGSGAGGGGGGGAGDSDNAGQDGGNGADGGGALVLNADNIDINGNIYVDGGSGGDGGDGSDAGCCDAGGGGGGGGGASGGGIMINGNTVEISGALSADGGPGGNKGYDGSGSYAQNGDNGHRGGGGRIKVFYGTLSDSSANYDVSGYNSGTIHKENVNSPPSISNVDPAESTGTSPVYTENPELIADINDPEGDSIDITYYSASVGTKETPARSCKEISDINSGAESGLYWIDPNQDGTAFEAYCEMDVKGGGWTLIMNLDQGNNQFTYSSNYWTNSQTYNNGDKTPNSDTSGSISAKYKGFNQLEGDSIMMRFKDPNHGVRYTDFSSMTAQELFNSGQNWASYNDNSCNALHDTHPDYDSDIMRFGTGGGGFGVNIDDNRAYGPINARLIMGQDEDPSNSVGNQEIAVGTDGYSAAWNSDGGDSGSCGYYGNGYSPSGSASASLWVREDTDYSNSAVLEQGSNRWQVSSYTGSQSSGNWYPGPVSGSNDFLIATYRDTSTGEESVIFGTEADSNMDAQLDLREVPSGSTVTRSDDQDGAGNPRHSRDELSLNHEPEGDWGWGSCCTDGAALQLGDNWNDIIVDPDTSVGVGPNFVFYEPNGNRIELDENAEVRIVKGQNNIIEEYNGVSSGEYSPEWSGLQFGETYSWYIKACDSQGACTTSNTFTFDVKQGPLEPVDPEPADGSVVDASSGTVDINARYRHANDMSGELRFYNAQNDNQLYTCSVNDGNKCSDPYTWSISSGEEYDWYAVAASDGATNRSSTWEFTANTPPDQPWNPSPNNVEGLDYNSLTLSADVNDEDNQDLEVTFEGSSPSDTFSKTTTVEDGSGTASVTVENLAPGETYTWTATADDGYTSTSSPDWSFTTNYKPNIQNPRPDDGEYVSDDQIEVRIDVSDNDGDPTDIEIYDEDGIQIGSGSTSDGSEVTVSGDYEDLSFGQTYDWTVRAEDTYGTTDKTFSFSVIGSGTFRAQTGIDYDYSSVIKSGTETSYVEYEVTNMNPSEKQLETSLQGLNAEFTQYDTSSYQYTLDGGETKTFRVEVLESNPGDYTLDIITRDRELGIENQDSIPVYVREFSASAVERAPGLMWIQLLFLAAGATVLYSALL